MKFTGRKSWFLDAFLVFAFAAWLIWPLFKVKYVDRWASIEATFIADARFLADHWPHPRWQPLWYCGTRWDFVYPPALRYGTAVLVKAVPRMLPVRAYHIYTAFFYAFGIAAMYLLFRALNGSRAWSALGALLSTLVSPAYLLLDHIREDSPYWVPQRLNVLVRYGEGPHISALGWVPAALAFAWLAFKTARPVYVVAAAFSAAMVVSNNFYGATALAMFFPILVWTYYITHLDRKVWLRAAGIAGLAFGLTAFWLTPSYLDLTIRNMQFVSEMGNLWSRWVALAVAIAFVLLSNRFAKGKPERAAMVFAAGSALWFVVNVVGNRYLNFRIIGEPLRLVPELDMALLFFGLEGLRRLWDGGGRVRRIAAGLVLVAAFASSYSFLKARKAFYPPDPFPDRRVEYELQDWIHKNAPQARVLVAGSTRFWYNAWHDLPQVGGGSEQGLLNPASVWSQWELLLGQDQNLALQWLRVLGADLAIVNDKTSRDLYHDYEHPGKFSGWPVVYDNKQGDIIYKVPRRFPGIGRVVDRGRLEKLPVLTKTWKPEEVAAHAELMESGPDRPVDVAWAGTDAFSAKASLGAGESLVLIVAHDPGWMATVNGQPVEIQRSPSGFMRLDLAEGQHEVRFHFALPWDNLAGRIVTVLTIGVIAWLLWSGRKAPAGPSTAAAA